jgi:hypothetical protein
VCRPPSGSDPPRDFQAVEAGQPDVERDLAEGKVTPEAARREYALKQ